MAHRSYTSAAPERPHLRSPRCRSFQPPAQWQGRVLSQQPVQRHAAVGAVPPAHHQQPFNSTTTRAHHHHQQEEHGPHKLSNQAQFVAPPPEGGQLIQRAQGNCSGERACVQPGACQIARKSRGRAGCGGHCGQVGKPGGAGAAGSCGWWAGLASAQHPTRGWGAAEGGLLRAGQVRGLRSAAAGQVARVRGVGGSTSSTVRFPS